jgi:hypothetical protein
MATWHHLHGTTTVPSSGEQTIPHLLTPDALRAIPSEPPSKHSGTCCHSDGLAPFIGNLPSPACAESLTPHLVPAGYPTSASSPPPPEDSATGYPQSRTTSSSCNSHPAQASPAPCALMWGSTPPAPTPISWSTSATSSRLPLLHPSPTSAATAVASSLGPLLP